MSARSFILWDGKQEVQAVACAAPSQLFAPAAGQSWVEITDDIATHTCDAKGATVSRTFPLDVAQNARWSQAKGYRQTKMAAGCMTPLGKVQTDPTSRDAITQAAADAMNNKLAVPAWSINWVMNDNAVKAHSALQMIALAGAVRAYITACQAASQAARASIYAATTAAAVAAIDITAGYPASS